MNFLILGVLEARDGDERVQIGGARNGVVLATLLLEAGRVVPLARLTEAVYGERVPATGRTQVQICVSALRRLFAEHGLPDAIDTRPPGYVLDLPEDGIDLRRYERAVRAAREEKSPEKAVDGYRSALAMWRGTALDGIDSAVVRAAADLLAENRLAALEECLDLELQLGRHRELIGELTAVVGEHPLRERLRGQLMLALYRSGRQADALDVYRRGRRLLIEELALEPGEALRDLERRILAADPSLSPASASASASDQAPGSINSSDLSSPSGPPKQPVPRLLPTDIADFTGRDDQLERIEQGLAEDPGRTAVPVVSLSGAAGVGKTTLAVHAAHRLAARYPDGQLYADLHGRTVGPGQVLERFLRALGLRGPALPDGLDERAERYRDLLGGRRILVVLDNAADEDQVRPLIPGSARSGLLVTSRLRLAGLPGATHLDLQVFDPGQSAELLSHIAGADRVEAEQSGAAELAELCGQLPLAIRIAGARLASRPHWSVRRLVDRLADEARRLDELSHSGLGVRASISLTYEQLGDPARRLFRLLTVPDFVDFAPWVAAALLDEDLDDARDLLDELADAQLLQVAGDRYRFHDLVRVYAREILLAEEPPADREPALQRVLGALLDIAERTAVDEETSAKGRPEATLLYTVRGMWPEKPVEDTSMSLLDAERLNLTAAVRQAADAGLSRHAWMLVNFAKELYTRRGYRADWREVNDVAMAAVERDGDRLGQARVLFSKGALLSTIQGYDESARALTAAAEIFAELGETGSWAQSHMNIALNEWVTGLIAAAEERIRMALVKLRQEGTPGSTAYALTRLAQCQLTEGDVTGAHASLAEALQLSRAGGARRIEAQVLHRLAEVYQQERRWDEAIGALREAYEIAKGLGDPVGQAFTLHGLGVACLRAGHLDEAEQALDDAALFARKSQLRLVEARVLVARGELAAARHDNQAAGERLRGALAMFRQMRAVSFERQVIQALEALADDGAPV